MQLPVWPQSQVCAGLVATGLSRVSEAAAPVEGPVLVPEPEHISALVPVDGLSDIVT